MKTREPAENPRLKNPLIRFPQMTQTLADITPSPSQGEPGCRTGRGRGEAVSALICEIRGRLTAGLFGFVSRGLTLTAMLLLVLLVKTTLAQQTGNTFAAGGPLGIYISLGNTFPNSSRPVNGGVSYIIKRRISGEKNWQQIATVASPTTLQDFRSRLETAMHQVPDSMSISNIPADTLWGRISRYGVADSLRFWSGALLIRLATGLMYLDTTAQAGTNYQYRVSLVDPSGTAVSTSLSNVISFPQAIILPKFHVFSKFATEREIIIEWTSGPGKGVNLFKTYRQDSLRGGFASVGTGRLIVGRHDSIFYMIADTLIQPMQGYRYFLVPMDYYGNTGIASDTVMVGSYSFHNVPLPDRFYVTSVDSPAGGIHVGWRLSSPQLVRNMEIYRSVDFDTGFHKLGDISTGDTSYLDQTVRPMQRYFYYLVMRGPLGETSPPSAKVFGMYLSPTAPLAPGLIGVVGTSNGVQLKIISTDIHQTDFQIYRSDGFRTELHLISGLVPRKDSVTDFEDTSSVLSGKLTYAYAVRAENASHVFSLFSDTIHARPHLPTHPPTPLGLNATVEGKYVQLYWDDMRAIDNTVEGYFVFRSETIRGRRESKFTRLNDSLLSASTNRFRDTTAEAGRVYEYAVRDYDYFGGESSMSSTSRAEIAEVRPIPPGGIQATVTPEGVLVQWDKTYQPDLREYRVYRYERSQRPVRISYVLASRNLETLDRSARRGYLYFYYVTSVNVKGVESGRSTEVGIRR